MPNKRVTKSRKVSTKLKPTKKSWFRLHPLRTALILILLGALAFGTSRAFIPQSTDINAVTTAKLLCSEFDQSTCGTIPASNGCRWEKGVDTTKMIEVECRQGSQNCNCETTGGKAGSPAGCYVDGYYVSGFRNKEFCKAEGGNWQNAGRATPGKTECTKMDTVAEPGAYSCVGNINIVPRVLPGEQDKPKNIKPVTAPKPEQQTTRQVSKKVNSRPVSMAKDPTRACLNTFKATLNWNQDVTTGNALVDQPITAGICSSSQTAIGSASYFPPPPPTCTWVCAWKYYRNKDNIKLTTCCMDNTVFESKTQDVCGGKGEGFKFSVQKTGSGNSQQLSDAEILARMSLPPDPRLTCQTGKGSNCNMKPITLEDYTYTVNNSKCDYLNSNLNAFCCP